MSGMSYPETDREQPGTKISPASGTARVSRFQCPKIFAVVLVFLILCFAKPLYGLVRYAWHSDLYSHILLIPFVSGYLVWSKKKNLACQSRGGRSFALFPLLAGLG